MKEPEDEAFEDLAKRQGDWGLQGSRKHQILRYAENVESKGTSMTQELLGRVHRELLDVLNSINQDKIHHDGDDFHELLNDVEKALSEHAMRKVQRLGQEIEQEPVAWAHYDTFKNLGFLTRARFTATLATKKTDACCIALYTHPINQKEFK